MRAYNIIFHAFGDGSAMECVALKAAMVLPALLLQKPHAKSKAKEHSAHLERRLKLGEKGDLDSLVIEGRTIQHQLEKRATTANEAKAVGQVARTFAKLMTYPSSSNAVHPRSSIVKRCPPSTSYCVSHMPRCTRLSQHLLTLGAHAQRGLR